MKKITIQDIADELGVSRNTVSKAINNSDGLAEATRERILQKAIEMGYKQFSFMKVREKDEIDREPQDKGEIALLAGNLIAPAHFALLMLDKLKRELDQCGYALNTHRVERDNFLCRTLPITFVPEQVRAIVCVEMFNRAYDEMICSLGLPVLFVDGPHKRDGIDLPADQIYMDNTTAITRFVNDMLVRGKRRIGFIGDYEHCQSFFERYTAYRCAMNGFASRRAARNAWKKCSSLCPHSRMYSSAPMTSSLTKPFTRCENSASRCLRTCSSAALTIRPIPAL